MERLPAAEALWQYEKQFGCDDGFLVKSLTDRVSNLYDEWRLFIYLFAEDKERVELLKRSSGLMFDTIKRSLWGSVLIKIRHLTDSAKTKRGQKNFSLEWLNEVSKNYGDCDLGSDWQQVLEVCKPVRRHVDKHIAHLDDQHARGKAKAPLNRKQTTDAVKSIGGYVQRFHETACQTTMTLLPTLQDLDHQNVLHLLHLGHQKQLENEEAIRSDWRLAHSDEFEFPDYLREKIDWFEPFS